MGLVPEETETDRGQAKRIKGLGQGRVDGISREACDCHC